MLFDILLVHVCSEQLCCILHSTVTFVLVVGYTATVWPYTDDSQPGSSAG